MNDSWPKVTFDEAPLQIIDGDRGSNYPKQGEFHDEGHCLFLNTGNVTKSGFDFGTCQFITEQKDNLLRKGKLSREDVIMTTRGTIGNVCYFNHNVPFEQIRINSGMVIFRVQREKLLPSFLYQYLRSEQFNKQVNSLRSGAAQPQLPIRDIKVIKLPLPSLDQQAAISGLISKYDDLIENNKRRIELLEESTRQLYREWFVRFRFPGHEHVKIIDGVPEGWQKKPIRDVLTLNYGKALKAETRVSGEIPVYGSSGEIGKHNKALVKGPGMVVGRKGNVGSIFWVHSDFFPIDTVYFVSAEESDYFIYYALLNTTFLNTDVAVPGLNRDMAYSREIMIPSDILRQEFLNEVTPIFELSNVLSKYNKQLSNARDLLLPKLMGGEIAV